MPNNSGYTYVNSFQELEPYMLYGDRSVAESPVEKKDTIVQDLDYLQGMYPGHMKRLQEYVVSACDHLDYKNSPMYDEFPDRTLINQICDSVCSQIRKEGIITDEQIIGTIDTEQATVETQYAEKMDWEIDEAEKADMLTQQRSSSWGPSPGPRPPHWGPSPGPRPPQGPPWGKPPGSRPPWGKPPGSRPPHWGPSPGPKPPYNNGWLNDIISVLLLNEMHRRRCRTGRCR